MSQSNSISILCYNIHMGKFVAPITGHQKHNRLWQIWVPLGLCIAIVLFLGVMAVLWTTQDVSGDFNTKWASISVVILSLPALIAGLLSFAILCGLIYLTSRLSRSLSQIIRRVLGFLLEFQGFVQHWGDKAVSPVIGIKSKWYGFTSILRKKT